MRRAWGVLSHNRRTLTWWLAGAIGWPGVLAVLVFAGADVSTLLRDPSSVSEAPASTGMFSLVGILVWGIGAGSCLLAAAVCARGFDRGEARFLLATGFVAVGAGVDDALLLHEEVFPNVVGIPEGVVLAVYGVAVVLWAAAYRRSFSPGVSVLLALAALSFALSFSVDLLIDFVLLEDAAKYLGLTTFVAFCVGQSLGSLARSAATHNLEGA